MLVGYRSFRDFFAVEIYRALLGREPDAADFLLDWIGGGLSVAALLPLARIKDRSAGTARGDGQGIFGGSLSTSFSSAS